VIDKQMKMIANAMAAEKEKIIRKAISSRIGDKWVDADLKGRGKLLLLQDGTEKFIFDGVEMIHFMLEKPDTTTIDLSTTLKVTQKYKLL